MYQALMASLWLFTQVALCHPPKPNGHFQVPNDYLPAISLNTHMNFLLIYKIAYFDFSSFSDRRDNQWKKNDAQQQQDANRQQKSNREWKAS